MITCPACGLLTPDNDGPTHAYMSPNAPCWAMYGEVLAREFSDTGYYRSHRLLTDAYCAHHSISSDRRARQSINIHLAGLMMHFEDGADAKTIVNFLRKAARVSEFAMLTIPSNGESVTIEAIFAATNVDEHSQEVDKYARKVFAYWQHEHPRIRALITEINT